MQPLPLYPGGYQGRGGHASDAPKKKKRPNAATTVKRLRAVAGQKRPPEEPVAVADGIEMAPGQAPPGWTCEERVEPAIAPPPPPADPAALMCDPFPSEEAATSTIFRCKFPGCLRSYWSTEAARKHARFTHPDWLKLLDAAAKLPRAEGRGRPRSAYCAKASAYCAREEASLLSPSSAVPKGGLLRLDFDSALFERLDGEGACGGEGEAAWGASSGGAASAADPPAGSLAATASFGGVRSPPSGSASVYSMRIGDVDWSCDGPELAFAPPPPPAPPPLPRHDEGGPRPTPGSLSVPMALCRQSMPMSQAVPIQEQAPPTGLPTVTACQPIGPPLSSQPLFCSEPPLAAPPLAAPPLVTAQMGEGDGSAAAVCEVSFEHIWAPAPPPMASVASAEPIG